MVPTVSMLSMASLVVVSLVIPALCAKPTSTNALPTLVATELLVTML
jgi:hypothetical protein